MGRFGKRGPAVNINLADLLGGEASKPPQQVFSDFLVQGALASQEVVGQDGFPEKPARREMVL